MKLIYLSYLVFGIILITILYQLYKKDSEGFDQSLARNIHVILSQDGKVINESYQQPSGDGIYGCTQVPCPDYIEDNKTCWFCCNYH